MSWVAIAIGGSALVGAGASIYGANKAADAQSDAAGRALDAQTSMFNSTQANLRPFIDTGKNAMYSLAQLYGLPGPDGQSPAGGAFNDNALEAFRKSPDYDFRFKEGSRALDFSDAARGMLNSSDHLRSTVAFGQGMAGQGFGDYANRLLALSQIGSSSANAGAGVGTAQGQILGNTIMAGGQAQASGIVGSTNAITGAIGGGMNNLMLYNLLNRGSAYSGSTQVGGMFGGPGLSQSAMGGGYGGGVYG